MRSLSLQPRLTLVEPVSKWTGIGMGSDGKFRVDGSAITAGYKCSTQVALKYVWGLTSQSETAALLSGTAFHAAMAAHVRQHPDPLAVFDEVYKEWAQANVAIEEKHSWSNTRLVVEHYLKTHPVNGSQVGGWPFQVVVVEIPFEVPLTVVDGVEIMFVGRIDVLGRYNGYLVVDDHKTTGWLNEQWRQQWSMSGQISGYVWAARQLYNEPVIGAFVTGVEWHKNRTDGNRKCTTHKVPQRECETQHINMEVVGLLERNDAMLDNWLADAVPMAESLYRMSMELGDDMEKLDQLKMEGVFTGECRWCEYRKGVCEIGRRAGVARASLEFNPWNPLEG